MWIGNEFKTTARYIKFANSTTIEEVSNNSDLSSAEGKKVLTEPTIIEAVNKNIIVTLPENTNISNVKSCLTEEDSTKPVFMYPSVLNSKITLDTLSKPIILDITDVTYMLNNPIEHYGVSLRVNDDYLTINDSTVDGSEDTKYLTKISVNSTNANINKNGNTVIAVQSPKGEIFLGYLDVENNCLRDLDRGLFINKDKNPIELKVLNNNDKLKILACNKVFLNSDGNIITTTNNIHWGTTDIKGEVGDLLYNISTNIWQQYNILNMWGEVIVDGKISVYNAFIGFAVCDEITCLATRCTDTQLCIDNINTLSEIRYSSDNRSAYSYTDENIVTVFDTLVDFNVDRLRWNVEDVCDGEVIPGNTYYMYINAYAETFVSVMKPIYMNKAQYYRHPYHYWRYIGSLTA